jgi:hypothetical protein
MARAGGLASRFRLDGGRVAEHPLYIAAADVSRLTSSSAGFNGKSIPQSLSELTFAATG